jgi:1,4-alpha-glucan branching enzyme
VHFELTYPSARRVCIAGSFNEWKPTDLMRLGGDKWAIDLRLSPGSYAYRLVVDGKWMEDPAAKQSVPNPFGEQNSLLSVPASFSA